MSLYQFNLYNKYTKRDATSTRMIMMAVVEISTIISRNLTFSFHSNPTYNLTMKSASCVVDVLLAISQGNRVIATGFFSNIRQVIMKRALIVSLGTQSFSETVYTVVKIQLETVIIKSISSNHTKTKSNYNKICHQGTYPTHHHTGRFAI